MPFTRLARIVSGPTAQVVLVWAGAFTFRILAQGPIENDHFLQLARAHQVVHGDWPIRDFVDPGQMLTYLLSSVAAALFGPTFLTEVVLMALLLSGAVAITFLLARRASGSVWIAATVALIEIAAYPRLYNAGKLFFPAVALFLAWRYADAPSMRRLAGLAAWTSCAFLWRHDYAVFMLMGTIALLVVQHRPATSAIRRLAAYFAWSAICLLPWLLYVQWMQGVTSYFRSALGYVSSEASRDGHRMAWSRWLERFPPGDCRLLCSPRPAFPGAVVKRAVVLMPDDRTGGLYGGPRACR